MHAGYVQSVAKLPLTHLGRPLRQLSRHTLHLAYAAVVTFAVTLGILWFVGVFKSDAPSLPTQVRAIEKKERTTRQGAVQNVEANLPLHGDGTRSWVLLFSERGTERLVIYDNEGGRLHERFEVTSRVPVRQLPTNFTFDGVPYSRLKAARKRAARQAWLRLYNPNVVFEKPVALPLDDGSRALLIPITAYTGPTVNRNTFRASLVAAFWSATNQKYVLHGLYPLRERWTVSGTEPLRLELRPGAGFRSLPTATDIQIDKLKGLVYATVGGGLATLGIGDVQVHAFRLPQSPDDLEECPVLWQGPAPVGRQKDVPRLERELATGCPQL
jgi:hypothetical protein